MAELIHLTAGKLLERTAELFPDHEAVVYPERGLRYTYAEFDRLCRQTAKGLMKLGIEKGDHVAIWASNIPEWRRSDHHQYEFSNRRAGLPADSFRRLGPDNHGFLPADILCRVGE